MIPKIVHQTSRNLTPEEARLGCRIRRLLPDWEYRFWSDADNDLLVEENFPKYLSMFRGIRRGVIRADIVRYMYLFVYGGFYFDTDYKVLRTFNEEILSHNCVLPLSRSNGDSFRLGNAVMGSEAAQPFWADFLAHIFATAGLVDLAESKIEEVTGPDGLTQFYLARQQMYDDIYLPAQPIFHPLHTYKGFFSQKRPMTVGVHLSWGSWRTKNPIAAALVLARRKLTSF